MNSEQEISKTRGLASPVEVQVAAPGEECLHCGIVGGFHEPTCLVYVRELESYRERLERQLAEAIFIRDEADRLYAEAVLRGIV